MPTSCWSKVSILSLVVQTSLYCPDCTDSVKDFMLVIINFFDFVSRGTATGNRCVTPIVTFHVGVIHLLCRLMKLPVTAGQSI